jgi:hypothetical protein
VSSVGFGYSIDDVVPAHVGGEIAEWLSAYPQLPQL